MHPYRTLFLLLSYLLVVLFSITNAQADTIELTGGARIEADIYVIKDGYHYLKVPSSSVSRVKYASRNVRNDTLILRTGQELGGKITAYMDDVYYLQVPSSLIRSTVSSGTRTSLNNGGVREGVLFRIHGSNTIGARLAPALAAEYLRNLGASNVEVKELKDEEIAVSGILPGNTVTSVIEIQSHGSSTAFQGLERRMADIGASSRRITSEEAGRLAGLGDFQTVASEHVLAIDGIAVIVNKNNPVFKLGKKDLQRIFSGEAADWSDFGGRAGKIAVYARDDKSGTFDTFRTLVLGKAKLVASARRFEDSAALSRAVSADLNGIGFIGLPYVLAAKAIAVSDGAEPIPPDAFTIATEDYPLSRRLFFYTPSSTSKAVSQFIEFALSDAGQKLVERTGFVDLAVKSIKQDEVRDVSSTYRMMVNNAERLSVNFRFSKNSYRLDNKALRDLKRVSAFLSAPANKGRRVLLLGFTDSLGSFSADQVLSEKRARAVQTELAALGISVRTADVAGFSKLNPIASNETPEGREKNRRVEIWLKEAGK